MYFLLTICFTILGTRELLSVKVPNCGCHVMRPCYKKMLESLLDRDEAACVENAEISPASIQIYLKALKEFCGEVVDVVEESKTSEFRSLYEVIVSIEKPRFLGSDNEKKEEKPVIIIDAGQRAGVAPVEFAVYIIQQLTACNEYDYMIKNVKWVILPSTNPDGMEIGRFTRRHWYKNMRVHHDKISAGVDISRNFDYQWGSCHPNPRPSTQEFPGNQACTEEETKFVKNVFNKYKSSTKAYVSLRRDGHSILYPYGYSKDKPVQDSQIEEVAGLITVKVNQKAGTVQLFTNKSIFEEDGKAYCGNSVDYAYDSGIQLSYEMRVFLGGSSDILEMFQPLPRGFEPSLRSGYFNGLKGLYIVVNDKHTKSSQASLRSRLRKQSFKPQGKQVVL